MFWPGTAAQSRVWTNMGWLFADRLVRQGVGLVILIWLARYLGPTDFGLFNYAIAYVALIWSFTDLGLSSIVVRNLVNKPSETRQILGSTFFLRLGAVVLAWGISVAGIDWLRPGRPLMATLVMVIATGMTFQISDTLAWWFEALVQSKYIVWARSSAFLLSAALRVVLILSHAPLVAFAYANATELVLAAIGIVIVFYARQTVHFRFHMSWSTAHSLLRDSWPLIFSNLAIVLYMRLDQVMLGNMRGDAEVGIYSVVVLIAEAAYIIPMIVMPSLLPDIVAAKQQSDALFYERLDHLYRLIAFLAYAIAVPLALTSGWLVKFLFGSAYASGGPVLAVLAFAVFLLSWASPAPPSSLP
jgi:PST family polysaccharide transporter